MRSVRYMLLVFGFFLMIFPPSILAEDLAETAYDESEVLPFEATEPVSFAECFGASTTLGKTQAVSGARTEHVDAFTKRHRSGDAPRELQRRELSSFLCSLIC